MERARSGGAGVPLQPLDEIRDRLDSGLVLAGPVVVLDLVLRQEAADAAAARPSKFPLSALCLRRALRSRLLLCLAPFCVFPGGFLVALALLLSLLRPLLLVLGELLRSELLLFLASLLVFDPLLRGDLLLLGAPLRGLSFLDLATLGRFSGGFLVALALLGLGLGASVGLLGLRLEPCCLFPLPSACVSPRLRLGLQPGAFRSFGLGSGVRFCLAAGGFLRGEA